MIPSIPVPATDAPWERPFWQGLASGELRAQHCECCDRWYFPPRRRCAYCALDLRWRVLSGRGRIWSFTAVHPPVLPAFAPFAPYVVALIEMEEATGLRMVGNVVFDAGDAINRVGADGLRIGQPVRALIRPLAESVDWPQWRLL